MTKNSPEIIILKQKIEDSVQRTMRTPSDFEFLCGAIWERLHEQLSPTTLKRLWGYIDGANSTRNSTLNVLSRFLGYTHWDDFAKQLNENKEVHSAELFGRSLRTADLKRGDYVEISWLPNRHCKLLYEGRLSFRVVESQNSKLHVNDTFQCAFFVIGQPLYIDNLVQDGKAPTMFVVGNKGGLTEAKKV